MSPEARSAEDLAAVTAENRLTSDPFPRRMVARDQANQGAAVLLTSVGKARELGVPEDRWVYLHGGADVRERTPMERADLSQSPASDAGGAPGAGRRRRVARPTSPPSTSTAASRSRCSTSATRWASRPTTRAA